MPLTAGFGHPEGTHSDNQRQASGAPKRTYEVSRESGLVFHSSERLSSFRRLGRVWIRSILIAGMVRFMSYDLRSNSAVLSHAVR